MYPIRIQTQRLVLREFATSDVEAVHAIIGDDTVTRWLSFDSRTLDQAESMIAGAIDRASIHPRTEYYLAVSLLGTNDLIGFARLGFNGVQAAKLGYAIHALHWGHGLATEAAEAMLDLGFHHLALHRISAAIGPDNAASIAVIMQLGFTYEGRIRDHVFTNGSWRDSLLYSKLAHEHRA
jgi:ribosomal-protein-alanine N-acetyltransferase